MIWMLSWLHCGFLDECICLKFMCCDTGNFFSENCPNFVSALHTPRQVNERDQTDLSGEEFVTLFQVLGGGLQVALLTTQQSQQKKLRLCSNGLSRSRNERFVMHTHLQALVGLPNKKYSLLPVWPIQNHTCFGPKHISQSSGKHETNILHLPHVSKH